MHIVPADESIVTTPPDSSLSSAPPCPVCGQPATSEVKRVRSGVTEANYCCGEHVWLTKWVSA